MHTCVCVYIYIYISLSTYIYIYIYAYTHIHTSSGGAGGGLAHHGEPPRPGQGARARQTGAESEVRPPKGFSPIFTGFSLCVLCWLESRFSPVSTDCSSRPRALFCPSLLGSYGQFSKFHVCFCGLDPGNLKFETVRTNKQHICF